MTVGAKYHSGGCPASAGIFGVLVAVHDRIRRFPSSRSVNAMPPGSCEQFNCSCAGRAIVRLRLTPGAGPAKVRIFEKNGRVTVFLIVNCSFEPTSIPGKFAASTFAPG